MREVILSSKFRRDLKKVQRAVDESVLSALNLAVGLLAEDSPLPENFKDHMLRGDFKKFRECHIRPDILLVYFKSPGILHLSRLGSHSELFG